MSDEQYFLTPTGRRIIRGLLISTFLLIMFVVGHWMLEQTMNSVVILKRNYVDVPFYFLQVDVWLYHDLAYALIWLSYLGLISCEITPWRRVQLTRGMVITALLGFACLTAGLWLTQDTMNAVLSLNRTYVDFPFFAWKSDLYTARDAARMLMILGFVLFYAFIRLFKRE